MAESASTRDWTVIGLGAVTAVIGIYFSLAGLGLAPEPGARSADTPAWIALVVGLVFSAAGLAVLLRGLAGADDKSGDLPAGSEVSRVRPRARTLVRRSADRRES